MLSLHRFYVAFVYDTDGSIWAAYADTTLAQVSATVAAYAPSGLRVVYSRDLKWCR